MPAPTLQLRSFAREDPSRNLVWDAHADICVLALDKFGQECVCLARKWHPDLFADPRIRLFRFEEKEEEGWETYPPGSLEEPDSFEVSLADYLAGNSDRLRKAAAQFFNQTSLDPQGELARIDGARHDQCITVGSALNVLSMARAVTLCEEFFSDARLINIWRFCCFWACSEETRLVEADTKEAIHQSLAWAREGFTRIGKCFVDHKADDFLPLAPQFLAGRALDQASPLLPRQDSSVILANAMIGRIYQIRSRIAHGSPDIEPKSVLEFDFQTYASSGAVVGHHLDSGKPFHHLGGFVVRSDVDGMCRAAAYAILAKWHDLLAEQPEPEAADLGPAIEQGDETLKKWIAGNVDRVFADVTARLARAGLARRESAGAFGHTWLQSVLSWQQEREEWEQKTAESFGWEILSEKPLEDWDQELQKHDLVADLFFVRSREAFLEGFREAFLLSWDEAVRAGMGKAIEREVASPAKGRFRPNLLCRRLVYALKERLVKEQADAERAEAGAQNRQLYDDATLEGVPRVINARLARLKKALRCAPAPWLWWWLLPGFLLLGLHLFQVSDFDFYARMTPEQVFWCKLGLGVSAALAAGIASHAWGRHHKRYLEHLFEQWHTLKKEHHEIRLTQQARESSRWAFERAQHFLDAMDPPVEQVSGPPSAGLILLRHYRELSRQAASQYQQKARTQLQRLRGANRELVLPPWPEDGDTAWEKLQEMCADIIGGQAGEDGIRQQFQKTLQSMLDFFTANKDERHLPWLQLEPNQENRALSQWTADLEPEMRHTEEGWSARDEKMDSCIDSISCWLKESSKLPSQPVSDWVKQQILQTGGVEPAVQSWIENNRLPICPARMNLPTASRAIAPRKDGFTDAFFSDRDRGSVIEQEGLPYYGFITTTLPLGLEDILSQFDLPGTGKRAKEPGRGAGAREPDPGESPDI